MCVVQDLLAPGASNFYAVNDYIAAATSNPHAPAKAFVLSGLMSQSEQVSVSVAVPCLKDELFV